MAPNVASTGGFDRLGRKREFTIFRGDRGGSTEVFRLCWNRALRVRKFSPGFSPRGLSGDRGDRFSRERGLVFLRNPWKETVFLTFFPEALVAPPAGAELFLPVGFIGNSPFGAQLDNPL